MASDMQQTPFIKELASSDRVAREKALDSLRLYLSSGRQFSALELLKLWRGLFFCMYHTPSPLPSQRLTSVYVTLLESLPRSLINPFLRAFYSTIGAEFHSLDRYRLDKYLYLIRRYVNAAFVLFKRDAWADRSGLGVYLGMLEEGPLCPDNEKEAGELALPKGPDGLRYHLLDIWVDELEKVVGEEETEEDFPIEDLMRPVRILKEKGVTKEVRKRAKETLEDERVRRWQGEEVEVEKKFDAEAEDAEWGGFDD